jgi:hypothetical protein
MILKLIENWGDSKSAEISLSKEDQKQLEPLLFNSLKKELKGSITLKVSDRVSKGFRIRLTDDDLYYDLTDENIAEIFQLFVNPKVKEIWTSIRRAVPHPTLNSMCRAPTATGKTINRQKETFGLLDFCWH